MDERCMYYGEVNRNETFLNLFENASGEREVFSIGT